MHVRLFLGAQKVHGKLRARNLYKLDFDLLVRLRARNSLQTRRPREKHVVSGYQEAEGDARAAKT